MIHAVGLPGRRNSSSGAATRSREGPLAARSTASVSAAHAPMPAYTIQRSPVAASTAPAQIGPTIAPSAKNRFSRLIALGAS
jgi:hypothetical protein